MIDPDPDCPVCSPVGALGPPLLEGLKPEQHERLHEVVEQRRARK